MQNIEKQICTKCILDENIPGIIFNDEGVCNYCVEHELRDINFPQGEEGHRVLTEICDRIKKEGEGHDYDCIVGISGGADSTYSLYLAKKYGLRPLAVLFDNGWSSISP